jgi:Tfp pilus assembly protein PilF
MTQTETAARKIAAALQAAMAAQRAGRLADAERLFRKILRTAPEQCDALHGLGTVLHQTGAHDRALGFFERASRAGGGSGVEVNRASALMALGRHDDAVAALDRALRIHPGDAALHYNRGNALLALGHNREADAAFAAALSIRPNLIDALKNRALALTELGRHAEALEACTRLLAIAPDFPPAHRHAAHAALMLGDYARGWREYEWRWRDPEASVFHRRLAAPRWTGTQDLAGRTLLLHAEQGLGDAIQFSRFVPLVAGRTGRIVLEAPASLLPLFRGLPGVDACVAAGSPLPPHDFHTALMSLPAILGTTRENIPADVPYLRADPDRIADWQAWLGPARGLRIGLAWSGSPTNVHDRKRSVPLAALATLAGEKIELVAVQNDLRLADQAAARDIGIRLTAERLSDFGETAALMSNLDLVISVCSSPAHLAGALGRPVWVMLRWSADWRWLAGRTDSPWYPTARLFRQPQEGDWESVAAALRSAIRAGRVEAGPTGRTAPDRATNFAAGTDLPPCPGSRAAAIY